MTSVVHGGYLISSRRLWCWCWRSRRICNRFLAPKIQLRIASPNEVPNSLRCLGVITSQSEIVFAFWLVVAWIVLYVFYCITCIFIFILNKIFFIILKNCMGTYSPCLVSIILWPLLMITPMLFGFTCWNPRMSFFNLSIVSQISWNPVWH